jgi:CubicO group peptidase (beta-lactamase class C family)
VVPNRSVDPVAPAGSIWSSVSDMARWMRFVLDSGRAGGKQVLTRASFTEWLSPQIVVPAGSFYPTTALTRPHFITYGLGWFLHDYAGSAVAMHTGSIDGMIAIVGLVPDQRLGVVVLANLDHAELRHALMLRVLDMYAGRPSRDWSSELRTLYGNLERRGEEARQAFLRTRVSGTSPSLPLERYAGTYVDSLSGTVEISKRGERLHAAFGKGFRGWLEHWHYDTFVVHWEGEVNGEQVVTMVLDEKGSPDRLRTDFGAVTIEFSRRRP